MDKSFRKPISISITVEEFELFRKINEHKHVGNVEVFRRGLLSYAEIYKIPLTKEE
jgi:hypothetical protein